MTQTNLGPRVRSRSVWAGAVAAAGAFTGLLLYVAALGVVQYQSASACAVSAVVAGDPRYTGRLQWMPVRYECTWLDLPGAPSTTATGVDLAALSVVGGVLFLICAVALMVILTPWPRRRH